jgi:hypothetical protein
MLRQITPLQQAYLDAYTAASALVPRNLRQTVILFGGAASIAHGILDRKVKDVDILVGVEALAILDDAIISLREGFHRDCDGTIKWDKCDSQQNKLFEVKVELVEIGGPFVPQVPEVVGFGEGYVATLAELVRLRASTLVERGDASDHIDFVLLLSLARERKEKLPHLGEDEMKSMIEAVEMCEESRDTDELFMDVLGSFELGGVRYENWVAWAQSLGKF